MLNQYKLQGPTVKIEIEVEKEVAEIIGQMESFRKIPKSELANTALKRFIASHSDFMPPRGFEAAKK